MFDVLPPQGRMPDGDVLNTESIRKQRRARPLRPAVASARPRRMITAAPRTIQVAWKLPARLRKPIREQLAKEHKLRARRNAIISFDRRPIHTHALLVGNREGTPDHGGITLPRRRIFNRGAEHHTGDTYKHSRPQLQVAAPPYVGRIVQNAPVAVRRMRSAPPVRQQLPPSRHLPAAARPRFDLARRPQAQRRQLASTYLAGERDLAYHWPEKLIAESSIKYEPAAARPDQELPENSAAPKRSLALPFSFSLWPKFLWRDKHPAGEAGYAAGSQESAAKKKVQAGRIIDLTHINSDRLA